MRPEIQLKALAQGLVIHLADGALPGRARIGDHDIHAAEGRDHRVEGRAHAGGIGDVAFHRQRLAADLFGHGFGGFQVAVQDGDFRALLRHGACAVAAPMPEPPPVITATWRASDFSFDLPSLACSSDQYSTSNMSIFADAAIFADGLGVGDHGDGILGDVGGDGGVLGGGADAEHAHARHQDHARQGIQFLLLHRALGVVVVRNSGDSARHRPSTASRTSFAHSLQLAGFRRRHDQRPVLGADGVVGRHHADLAVARQFRAVHIIQNRGIGAEIQDLPLGGAGHGVFLDRHRAAQDGRDLRHARRSWRAAWPGPAVLR